MTDTHDRRLAWVSILTSDRALLAIIFFTALIARLLYLYDVSGNVFFRTLVVDQQAYDEWARHMLDTGDWIGDRPFYQDPLYPYFLAVLYLFSRDCVFVYVCQSVIAALGCLALFGIGRRAFGGRRVAFLGAMLWALYKIDFYFTGQVEKTSPGIALTLFALWLIFVFRDRPSVKAAIPAGIVSGLTLLFRGNLLVVFPLLLAAVTAESFRRNRRAALAIAALWLGFAAPPAASAIRNFVVSGEFILTTAQGGVNFYVGNFRDNILGAGKDPAWARRVPLFEEDDFKRRARELTGRDLSPREMSKFWFREGLKEIVADPALAVKREFNKALLILSWYEVSDNLPMGLFHDEYSFMLRLPLPAFWLAGPFGLAGLAITLYRKKGGLLALYLAAYAATLMIFYIVARYRLPLVPVLLLFAANGMFEAAWAVREKKRREIAMYMAVWLLASMSSLLVAHGDNYDQAYTKVGNAYARQGDIQMSIEAYQKALEINPDQTGALMGLGLSYLDKNRWDEALALFERMSEINPQDPSGPYLQAVTYEMLRQSGKALELYRKTLEIEPGQPEATQAIQRLESAAVP